MAIEDTASAENTETAAEIIAWPVVAIERVRGHNGGTAICVRGLDKVDNIGRQIAIYRDGKYKYTFDLSSIRFMTDPADVDIVGNTWGLVVRYMPKDLVQRGDEVRPLEDTSAIELWLKFDALRP